jgi:DNA-directed RNA polymerase subunit RPC12/RpoP
MTNLPAGYECRACGARVESLTVDWADDQGQRLIAEEAPMWCAECSSPDPSRAGSFAGRRWSAEGSRRVGDRDNDLIEFVVEGGFGFSATFEGSAGDLKAFVEGVTATR